MTEDEEREAYRYIMQNASRAAEAWRQQVQVTLIGPLSQQLGEMFGNMGDAFAGMRLAMQTAFAPVVHWAELENAARARGRHRRKLIDRIARERGVRPSEIRRKVADIRAQL